QVQQATQPIRSRADMGIYTSNNNYDDYAYLGIHTNRLTEEKAAKMGYDNPYGTVVSSVIPNTAADKAGLQVLDYLYGIDEYRLGEEQSLRTILKKYRPDDSATLLVYRKGEKRELAVTFGERTNDDDDNDNDDECEDPFLGVRKQHDNDPRDGVAVNIVDNSTAEAIKMKDGDLITYINGYRILDWTDLRLAINMIKVGQPIAVTVERNGNTLTREGRIMSECEFDEYDGDSDDDWEDKLEDKMEKLGEDLERMGEEIGEKVGQAMENLFDGSNRSDRDDAEADNDDWYEEQKRRRRTDADREMPIDQVAVEMEDMEEPEMRQLAANAKIDMPQNRVLMVNELTLSPNPNMGMFVLSFDLPNMGDTRIRIFNALGRLIYEYELGDFSGSFTDPIDISQNGAGAYFLLVEQNGQAMTKKIILTKD
ncbi:MAG: PDZ domain-containing protein, partial [Bacteroidota bacterium]